MPLLPDLAARIKTAGQQANQTQAGRTFRRYHKRIAGATKVRHEADLATFATFLEAIGAIQQAETPIYASELVYEPEAWRGITWGLIEGFREWMLDMGFAIDTVRLKLSTARRYASLAGVAGVIEPDELRMIASVKAPSHAEGQRVDQEREVTRIGPKKARANILTVEQVMRLKALPPRDTPQGRRDALLLALLADLGLRVSEVVPLTVDHLDLERGLIRVRREKTSDDQTLELSPDALIAAEQHLSLDIGTLPEGHPATLTARGTKEARPTKRTNYLLRGSRKTGELAYGQMSDKAIRNRVQLWGEQLGISNLSPHDLRHTYATLAYRAGTDPIALMHALGHSSTRMIERHYVEPEQIANARVQRPNISD